MTNQLPQQTWRVTTDFPYALQLWAYVGKFERFRAFTDQHTSPIESTWHIWGNHLISSQTSTEFVASPYFERQDVPMGNTIFIPDPPSFHHLAEFPDLQALCQKHWPDFHTFWDSTDGIGDILSSRIHSQMRSARINQLVKASSKSKQDRTPRPFHLHIDFTHWPEMALRQISNDHLLLGTAYLQSAQLRSELLQK